MKKANRLRQPTLLIFFSACLLLGACDKHDSSAQIPLKTYRHSLEHAPGSLDPAQTSSVYSQILVVNLYDTLYRYKYLARPYQLEPNLATRLPIISDDGLRLTIPIKKGVHFIDDPAFADGIGREVKASDFVYSIKRHFDPETRAQGAWLWQGRIKGLDDWKTQGSDYQQQVEGLRAVDDYTIEITLNEPFPQLVHTLTQGYSAIVPHEAVTTYAQGLANHPVGSGPFMLSSRNSANALLTKNENFRKIAFDLQSEGYDAATQGHLGLENLQGQFPPFIDQLYIEFINESAARWNAFSAGEVQYIKVPAVNFDNVLNSTSPISIRPELAESYHFEAAPESGFVYTNFNMADETIGYHEDEEQNQRNRALRCAMVKAFDWKENNEVFFHGIGQVFPGIIPPFSPEFQAGANGAYIERDVEGAKRLLEQYGWTSENLPAINYGITNTVIERQAFEQIRGFLTDIGYPREKISPIIFASFGDFYRAYSQGKVSLINTSWTMDYPDVENVMQLFYGPNASPGANSSSFNNPEYNRLYQLAASMPASPERTDIYQKMNQIMMEGCPTISGITRTNLFLWDKDVIMHPDRSFLGGFFFRFIDLLAGEATTQ